MIVKNPEYMYVVSYVSKGGTEEKPWTRFSIPDFDKKQKRNTFITVLVFGEFDVRDGDKVSFIDYQVGVNKFRENVQATLFVSVDDIVLAEMAQDQAMPEVNTDTLPF